MTAFQFTPPLPASVENNDGRLKSVIGQAFHAVGYAAAGFNVDYTNEDVANALVAAVADYADAYARACIAAAPQGATVQRAEIFEGLAAYFGQSGGSTTWRDVQLEQLMTEEAHMIRTGKRGKVAPKAVQAEQDLAKVRADLAATKLGKRAISEFDLTEDHEIRATLRRTGVEETDLDKAFEGVRALAAGGLLPEIADDVDLYDDTPRDDGKLTPAQARRMGLIP